MKKIKVFQDGVYLRDIYPHATKWQVIKFRVAQWIGNQIRKIINFIVYWTKLGVVTSFAVVLGAFLYGNYTGANTIVFASVEKEDTLFIKIDELKDQVVNDLSLKENPTLIPAVYDDNKAKSLPKKDKISYGCMQMKISTIQLFSKQLGKENISDLDAVYLALDCEKAKEFSKEAIFGIKGALWHWSTATKEMGAKVELIKSLEK